MIESLLWMRRRGEGERLRTYEDGRGSEGDMEECKELCRRSGACTIDDLVVFLSNICFFFLSTSQ